MSEHILAQDSLSIFSHVPTQLSLGDKRSLLALQAALGQVRVPYNYLEIGSYLGGSLQPFLVDERCERIISIDSRPQGQPGDERQRFKWTPVSTQDMLDRLRPAFGRYFDKLTCIDAESRTIQQSQIQHAPHLCFIDGEHTDIACFNDFKLSLSVASPDCAILFHDIQIIFRGLKQCLAYLDRQQKTYRFYLLPGKMAVIEIGSLHLARSESVFSCLVNDRDEILESLERLGYYRDWYAQAKTARLARALSRLYDVLRIDRRWGRI